MTTHDAGGTAPQGENIRMSEQEVADVRFRDALDELDARRADLKGMFEAASGWRWLSAPVRRASSVAMAGGVVLHQLVEAGGTGRDGVVGPSRLTVVAAQGGSDERRVGSSVRSRTIARVNDTSSL
jgi:hypothetical protein